MTVQWKNHIFAWPNSGSPKARSQWKSIPRQCAIFFLQEGIWHYPVKRLDKIYPKNGNEILSSEIDAPATVSEMPMPINVRENSNFRNEFLQFCNHQNKKALSCDRPWVLFFLFISNGNNMVLGARRSRRPGRPQNGFSRNKVLSSRCITDFLSLGSIHIYMVQAI